MAETSHRPAVPDVLVSRTWVEPAPVKALAALFDDGLPAPGRGDVLPPLWHWVAVASWSGASSTGHDGHQMTGGFLPDLGKPRRMFAGGRVSIYVPLVVGEEVRREDRVVSVASKSGRRGDFMLVQIETELYDRQGRLAVRERQDLVYRDSVPPRAQPGPPEVSPEPVAAALLQRERGGWSFHTDPTKLMRFSGATSNGHRIHYDLPYATQVEGYPGLVVHGPLMTLALAEVVRLEGGLPRITSLSHRAVRPLFCGESADVTLASLGSGRMQLALTKGTEVHSSLAVEPPRCGDAWPRSW
jgi:3-methylfumaryl-CoA hydratase